MKKTDLIKRIFDKRRNLSYTQANDVVNVMLSTLSDGIAKNGRVEVREFGSFSRKKINSTKFRDPRNGGKVFKENQMKINFRAGKELKERVNNDG